MAMILRAAITGALLPGFAFAAAAADTDTAPKHRARRAPYRECCGEVYRYAYAEAWYGNQKIVAPVRRVGCCDQVQIPGGAWIDCGFSCEITMRKMPLWYWQKQGAGVTADAPDYPRRDYYTDGWGIKHHYWF
jgi:hypothetical protein